MKKLLFLITGVTGLALCLSACESKKNTEDYITAENFTLYTDTTYPETAISSVESAADITKPHHLSYALNGSTVELRINNELVGTIDNYYTPPVEYIAVGDYNFDGYDDIFIPYEDPVDMGTYYCYDAAKNSFIGNDALNAFGRAMKVSEDGCLYSETVGENSRSVIEYSWKGNSLEAVKKTDTYISSESGNTITDIYGYDENGYEMLIDTVIGTN